MTLDEVMRALEKAGTAQAKKTYARHGAMEPMYGVSFATLKTLYKKIGRGPRPRARAVGHGQLTTRGTSRSRSWTPQSYLHGHSARARASCRHAGGRPPYRPQELNGVSERPMIIPHDDHAPPATTL